MRGWHGLALILLATLPSQAIAAGDPARADCDASATSRVLQPAADARTDARAYWLDGRTLRWPGKPDDGRYRLAWSRSAQLRVGTDRRLAGADGTLPLARSTRAAPAAFAFVPTGAQRALTAADAATLRAHVDAQWWAIQLDAQGRVVDATYVQSPGLLDAGFDGDRAALGPRRQGDDLALGVWGPTASRVSVCQYADADAPASAVVPLQRDAATGAWHARLRKAGGAYYTYLVDVLVPGIGRVRNRVTDPYATGLATDSTRSAALDVTDAANPSLAPSGWAAHPRPAPAASNVDMTVYELHVRDFSVSDESVPAAHRGKYLAVTDGASNGMRHLQALQRAGLTDLHLLPVFDIATIPERGCVTPAIPPSAPDSPAVQAGIGAVAARDCFNWGYDPYHFGVPEGSYATSTDDAATRIREFRAMVQALHGLGLRVGMDVVYNHTTTSGQADTSVLDRIVPGYYHRLDANGAVERSTCCANTATEHRMMARLMADTLVTWARDYGIDSFRFDLMGHQPRAAMERAQAALREAVGHDVPLIGEGWNFGEVADGARFVQAAQGRLDGTHVATYSDRARDALRGGGCCDSGEALLTQQGWLNGLVDAPERRTEAMKAADLVRAGLAGTLRGYTATFADGRTAPLSMLDYKGAPAGYASQPDEVVNYVENHDNLTLFDVDALRLPRGTSPAERARVQALGIAVVALSQGVAYYHAGIDVLRSKSLDRNSFDSGDAFNRLDWTYTDNGFGVGLPPAADNGKDWPLLAPVLRDASIKPAPRDIAWTRDVFRDWLALRAATPLLRLRSGAEVQRRLTFPASGPSQDPALIVGHLDGSGLPGARELLYLVNASARERVVELPGEAGKPYVLHPVQRAGTDARVRDARHDGRGRFTVPGRSAAVFVIE
ncbi:alpha-1,6-glucosidase domain-containing protein [Cognatilysobacter segetis]|uniref:alpha-1,6-glucosidase domain-containing protein n=1 Tax=Cognatilysobacter segetis TaxID=2492394 RepID=UPI0010612188|nr:alpha-1,6-glucosidase domain-containing protein [Lysobacter segetis]